MMVIYVGTSIPFRFIGGFVADRVSRSHLRLLMGGAYFAQAVGFTVFLLHPTTAMIPVWFALYGLGMGISFTVFATMVGRYFGRKAYGSIQGTKQMFMAPFSMAAPIYTGWVYDTTGSYTTAFIIFAILLAISAVLMSFTTPPKPPAHIGDVRQIV
jgi:MFS family permease